MFDSYRTKDALRKEARADSHVRQCMAGMVAALFANENDPRFPGCIFLDMNRDRAWEYYVKLSGMDEDTPDGSQWP
jgi:hypothetical protein